MTTLDELKNLRESEDKVEFKAATHNFSYAGSEHRSQEDRRRCFLGYITALANEKGGRLVLGMGDKHPHAVVGTDFAVGQVGELTDDVYARLSIRVSMQELFDDAGKRVLVVEVPSRPLGKTLKFEGVPLMRTGESLRNMSDEELFAILSEQEPDFSARLCTGATIDELNSEAITRLKSAYAIKQENPQFLTLSNAQALSDLGLMVGNGITYAALILLGTTEALDKFLPQSAIHLEYRNARSQITFDNRKIFRGPYYLTIESVWELINGRNGKVPVQEGPYIFDIPFFNQEVIREAVNNAVAHRDYRRTSEAVIKQYPNELHILNPGGFPLGVTLENLLTVSSTPRNRLLADVMAKTGVVERSGQGIDKIFYQSISEAKPEPDYGHSDDFQVELRLSAIVEDKAFALFIRQVQQQRRDDEKLSVQEVRVLNLIRKGTDKKVLDAGILKKLEKEGLIERVGKTNAQQFILSKAYYIFSDRKGVYVAGKPLQFYQIAMLIGQYFKEFDTATMGDFVRLLDHHLTRSQVKYQIDQLVSKRLLEKSGKGKGTIYRLGEASVNDINLLNRALEIGNETLSKNQEVKEP